MNRARPENVVTGLLLAATLAWATLLHGFWAYALTGPRPVFLEPQGNVRSHLGAAWRDSGSPAAPIARFDELPAEIAIALTPRDAALLDGRLVPKDYASPVAVNAVAGTFGIWGEVLAAAGFSFLAVLLAGYACFCVSGSRPLGAAGALLFGSNLVWWSANYGGVSYTPAAIACGYAMVALLLRRAGPTRLSWLLTGLLGGLACSFHYAMTPWWAAVTFALAFGRTGSARDRLVRATLAALGAAVVFLYLAAFNAWIYGSPVSTGYSVFGEILDAINWQSPSVGFDPGAFRVNMERYLLRAEILPFLVVLPTGFRALNRTRFRPGRIQLGVVALGAVSLLLLAGGSTVWGTTRFETNSSVMRYLSPLFGLVVLLAVLGLRHWWGSGSAGLRLLVVLFVVVVPIINIRSVFAESNGLPEARTLVQESKVTQDNLLAVIPEDGLVITRRGDKMLFPQRSTLTVAYLQSAQPSGVAGEHLYDTFPSPSRLATVIDQLDAWPVYILNDTEWLDPTSRDRLQKLLLPGGRCLVDESVPDLIRVSTSCGP